MKYIDFMSFYSKNSVGGNFQLLKPIIPFKNVFIKFLPTIMEKIFESKFCFLLPIKKTTGQDIINVMPTIVNLLESDIGKNLCFKLY